MEESYELRIKALAYRGKGLASIQKDGKTIPVFVKNALPEDTVKAIITRKHKKYLEAEITEIKQESPFRTENCCEHSSECGGCQFLNMNYKEQLRYKKGMLKAVLERNNKNIKAEDIMPAEKNTHYRIRARYHQKGKRFGFCKEQTNEIIDIKECRICDDLINRTAQEIKEKIRDGGGESEIEIIKNAGKEEVYIKAQTTNSKTAKKLKEFSESSPKIKGYSINKETKDAEFEIDRLRYHPECFTQVNPEQNRKMTELVTKEAEGKCLDLYCGIGNFTIPAAKRCISVTGVEGDRKSAEYAKKNSAGIKNINIYNLPVENFLEKDKEEYDTVILDPSRRSKTINFEKLKAKKIVYASCNPEQLSKDLKTLNSLGYKIKKIQPIDMFPQTYHIETITILER